MYLLHLERKNYSMPPSEEVSKIHNRMPIIFSKEQVENWINPNVDPSELHKYALTDMYTKNALG